MGAIDINLHEGGSGGETAIIGNDLVLTNQLYQQCYLCLFGGNKEASTIGNEPVGQPRFDWWANSLFFANDPAKQFNSLTEKALYSNALNSEGRLNILQAVETDLQNLKAVANITVNVVILSPGQVAIDIKLTEPNSGQNKILQFIWDKAANEVIINEII